MSEKRKDWRALDEAAIAALWALADAPVEHIGLLYEQDGRILATPTQTRGHNATTGGAFQIPKGSLRALFHNHPSRKRRGGMASESRDRIRAEFSPDDIEQAMALGVPSYIAAGQILRRYDPATNKAEDVPAELIQAYLRAKMLEGPNGVP